MDLLTIFGVHEVTVTPLTGYGARGETYGAEFTVTKCWVMEKTLLVRDKTGAEVPSTAQIALRPEHDVPVGSKITLPSGRETRVISVSKTPEVEQLSLPTHQILNCE